MEGGKDDPIFHLCSRGSLHLGTQLRIFRDPEQLRYRQRVL